jgi:peptidoglycan/LPS O-acetylase OafA/YrhL
MVQRFPALDGYRAASILLVLSGHLLALGPKPWRLNEAVAALGMTMFFSLSGFLIATQLLSDQNVGRFLTRRLSRILPLLLVYTFVIYVVLYYEPVKMVFTDLFVVNYLQRYLDGENGHLWSLCVEMHFYLAIALAVACAGRKAVFLVWPACFAITAIRIYSGAEISILTHLRVDEILVGACLATASHYWSRFRISQLLFCAAFVLTLLSCSPFTGPLQYARPYLTALLLIAAANQDPRSIFGGMLYSKIARYIANTSFALYVIHPAFTHGWFEATSIFDKYAIKRPIGIGLTFVLAHISTFYFERPCMAIGRTMKPDREIQAVKS